MNGNGSPFHAGEIAVQQRAGVREQVEAFGGRMIRDVMLPQHRDFFATLPTLLVGSVDAQGRPWASMLAGRPGFVHSPDERRLRIDTLPDAADPLASHLRVGAPIGLLGIEPPTRRRNRMNGQVVALDDGGFAVEVEQSFGNCPKYIQAREPQWHERAATGEAPQRLGPALNAAALTLVRGADTLFIASAASGGVDVSHRGGRPGFVQASERDGRVVLTLPDFSGNKLFNTLGNIEAHPCAGLLFVDHASGGLLQLSGAARIVWDGEELRGFAGAQRLVRIVVEAAIWRPQVLPLRWSAPEYAPQLEATGTWPAEACAAGT
jgi:predicted pyridoxine 5'-phosphate oxidase superfamily flavin-nucleotide-binding protein